MVRRLETKFENAQFPEAAAAQAAADSEQYGKGGKTDAVTLATAAAKVGGGSGRPVLVRFVNLSEGDPRSPEGKAVQRTVQNSRSLVGLFDVGNDDICIACKFFRLVSVDVSGVDPKISPEINRVNAPAVAILDAQGKVVETLGPGLIRKAELYAAINKALGPKVGLDRVVSEERSVIKDVLKLDSKKAQLDALKKRLESAKPGGRAAELEAEIAQVEKEVQEAEARIQERESKLFTNS